MMTVEPGSTVIGLLISLDFLSKAGDCAESAIERIISRENCRVRPRSARTPKGIVGIMRLAKSGCWEFSRESAESR